MGQVLIQAFVYLAAAVAAAPLARRFGLGSVLGYLIAGAIIGPFALNLVGETEQVALVAEYGVVILLFLIGLEVRPAMLWGMRTHIVGLGGAQVALSAAALGAAALAFGLPWREAAAAGVILAMSSTAIVLQMLEEKGLRRQAVGRAAFGVLLFQDLSVIPILAFLPLLAVAGAGAATGAAGHEADSLNLLAGQPPLIGATGVLLAVAAVVLAGIKLAPRVFRVVAATRMREMFTASALALVVGVAILMQLVGMSPALGAFLAGVVLADSEFRRELETDIEPFRGLLLGLFFLTVGAGLDVGLVMAEPLRLVGLVVVLMAVKAGVLTLACRVFRLGWREAGATGVALSQGGEFCFVLLSMAVGSKVLPAQLAAMLTAAVALSMALTPLVFLAYERLARPPAEPVEEPENEFEDRDPEVIVAGYGRFGQIVARLLNMNGFETAVLENSVEQIALLRRFGRKVYYGDAERLDLLRAAGAEKARVLVVAVDDKDKAKEIVETALQAFPHLKVLARAFDRRHAYELLNAGAHVVERETFEGGLALGAETLRALGWRAYRAERAARTFRRHDERQLESLRELWGDEERFVLAARESSPRMEDLLRADLARLQPGHVEEGWDTAEAGPVEPRPAMAEVDPAVARVE